jgi:putative polyketide hydroxylase
MREAWAPVLIAGGGTVGLSMALFLAHHGVRPLVVESQGGPSIHPRATGVGQRTVEFFHEVGIADAVNAAAIDMSTGGLGKISVETLATADLPAMARGMPSRSQQVGMPFDRISPCALRGTCPQDRLDAVLLPAARARGATVRYSTRLVSFDQDDGGVTAHIEGPGGPSVVRADYLVAADGVRSGVRSSLGIGTSGPGELGDPLINILFEADLREYTKGHSFVACDITNPDSPGMLVTVDGKSRWIFHVEYTGGDFTPERCATLIRAAIGVPDLDVRVLSTQPWRVRALLADRFQDGRVFLAGDAAHAVPPLGAFGMNTGIADAHNLAWKLAMVLNDQAGEALLESYEAERRPVAELTVEQAMLRLADPRLHWDRSPAQAAARAEAGVVNAPIVHLGYRYDSPAVIDPEPELPSHEDVELVLDGSPGSRLPHAWIEHNGERQSTLDLIQSRFTVLTVCETWIEAAHTVSSRAGLDLPAHKVIDHEGRWPDVVGIGENGALLVRPDGFVAWRAPKLTENPAADLAAAVLGILARSPIEMDLLQTNAG